MQSNYYAMTEFMESYYWATKDDSLGDILGSLNMWRNDDDTLFDKAISDDWEKFYDDISQQDHTLFEGFLVVEQFVNEYLADYEYSTELARNLTYTIRKICSMSVIERQSNPVWLNWLEAVKWVCNPDVVKVNESPFMTSKRKDATMAHKKEFPVAKVMPSIRPVIFDQSDGLQITQNQNYFMMISFLDQYFQSTNNPDLKVILTEFTPGKRTISQLDNWSNWNDYFIGVAHNEDTVNSVQALAVVCQFMQVWVPDNALHTFFGRKLTQDIWNVIYMKNEARKQTRIWKNWTLSVKKILGV
ncbi:hypothetical protein [Lactiplantibacillus pingfangensis]|uniref:hypothetical protein n=1 Tax=Lactiplantibacillus pingfangensis TaxID=2559915 RepID=UPI0010F8B6E8|nr:hypothetical protein [Lactiplantibacillus pingfangensis]